MNKGRPFAVFDIDGTLIRWQLYHAVADQLAKHGHLDSTTYENIRAARLLWKQRAHDESFKDYERRLIHAYDQLLPHLKIQQFTEASEAVFAQYKDQVYTYTRDLIHRLQKKGYLLFAISNSQTEIVRQNANYYKFDDYRGTDYERHNEFFTGKKSGHFDTKDLALQEMVERNHAIFKGSMAKGDSEGDISMLAIVERPIAFNPSKKLFEHARAHAWNIVLERKNMMYVFKEHDGQYVLV